MGLGWVVLVLVCFFFTWFSYLSLADRAESHKCNLQHAFSKLETLCHLPGECSAAQNSGIGGLSSCCVSCIGVLSGFSIGHDSQEGRVGLIPQGCAPHTARNQTDAFITFPFLLETAKQEWHKEIVLILPGPICCTLLWFSFIGDKEILRSWWGAALDTPYIFFCLYKNLSLWRGLRILWRPRPVF